MSARRLVMLLCLAEVLCMMGFGTFPAERLRHGDEIGPDDSGPDDSGPDEEAEMGEEPGEDGGEGEESPDT